MWRPVLMMLGAGVVGGVGWNLLAEPATLEATDGGLILTELASTDVFAVVALFVAIGIVVSAPLGFHLGGKSTTLGWPVVLVAVVVSFVAAVLAWRVGVWLGPPDPSTINGLRPGDTVAKPLAIDALAAFLAWPIAAVVALLLRVYMSSDD